MGSIAGSLIAIVILRRHLSSVVVIRGTAKALLVASAVLLFVGLQFTDMVEERIERTTSDDATQITAGRIDIWSAALSEMNENRMSFLLGNGWTSFRLIVDKGSHNTYLRILFELGLLGLSIYLILIYVVIDYMFRK